MSITSPFLHPGSHASPNSLSILHLRRDQLRPVILKETSQAETGYQEGAVENTRFGSYPHSNIIQRSWGSQIGATKVDTGSRGRQASQKRKAAAADGPTAKKQKRDSAQEAENTHEPLDAEVQNGVQAQSKDQQRSQPRGQTASGFCYLINPTPEAWTSSLPHRTQVVYTPDYSYIIHKMRVRPGSVIIEAGAGSGSFTHAAARAVFNGYQVPSHRKGKVYSYEYHEPRAKQLREELEEHGLSSIVKVTHRDVCKDGFLMSQDGTTTVETEDVSPRARHVFLDLPGPWDALRHLRHATEAVKSPFPPNSAIHICCFLPCLEQVTRVIAELRTEGWIDITMQELAHRKLEIRRERIGLQLQGLRGVNASAATVEESVERLKQLESQGQEYRGEDAGDESKPKEKTRETKQDRLARIAREEREDRKSFKEGRLVVKTEPEIKTHTSYLVFAILPAPIDPQQLILTA